MKIVVIGGGDSSDQNSFPGCASAETKQLPHLPIVVSILLAARDWPKF
jgi:hypothetical protein